MNILIAGASGLIGQRLVAALESNNKITVVGRNAAHLNKLFPQPITKSSWDLLDEVDATAFDCVINLSGYNISGSRWSSKVKQLLIDSRVQTTSTLISWLIKHQAKPHVLCANAVGIYGMQDRESNEQYDEKTAIDFDKPKDFMSEIGVQWQQALQPAIDFGMKVTSARFGVVLVKNGGMLKKLIPAFYMGMGSVLGDGKQMLSWIAMDDLIAALKFLISKPELSGVFNLTSPNPVPQAEFARTLADVMHRPLFLKMPEFVVKALFGEMGTALLLNGQAVVPTRLLEAGFVFAYPGLRDALVKINK